MSQWRSVVPNAPPGVRWWVSWAAFAPLPVADRDGKSIILTNEKVAQEFATYLATVKGGADQRTVIIVMGADKWELFQKEMEGTYRQCETVEDAKSACTNA